MTKKNANESLPEQPVGHGFVGTAAAPLENHRRPGDPVSSIPPPPPSSSPWGDPRPRRRQDREAGPSEKQVYVPPVTLPPNREHHAIDQQKIQVAPAVLKGVDERNRPTMRRIPMSGGAPSPPGIGAEDDNASSRTVGGRTARLEAGIGRGVWPPPEDEAQAAAQRYNSSRTQRLQAHPGSAAAAIAPGNAGGPLPASSQNPAALLTTSRKTRMPIAPVVLLVLLSGAAAVGVWMLYQRSMAPRDRDQAEEISAPVKPAHPVVREATPEPGKAALAPSATAPARPDTASPAEPVEPIVEANTAPPSAEPENDQASASGSGRPAPQGHPSRPRPEGEPYNGSATKPPSTRPPPVTASPPPASPPPVATSQPTPTTAAPPRPF